VLLLWLSPPKNGCDENQMPMTLKSPSFALTLQSARQIALTAQPYFEAIVSGSEDFQFFSISALRLNAARAETLREQLAIIGDPVEPGLCVADVLNGNANWTSEEAADLKLCLENDPAFADWLRTMCEDLDAAIRRHPVFGSSLVENDFDLTRPNPDMLLRAVVLKAAMKPNAMETIRKKFI